MHDLRAKEERKRNETFVESHILVSGVCHQFLNTTRYKVNVTQRCIFILGRGNTVAGKPNKKTTRKTIHNLLTIMFNM